jgi:hypothetical protein
LQNQTENKLNNNFYLFIFETRDETLSSLGESSKTVIYLNVEEKLSIKREEIPNHLEDFLDHLNKVFGSGTQYFDILFMKNLNTKLNPAQKLGSIDWVIPVLTFTVFVKIKRNQFEKSLENDEREVLVDAERTNKFFD